MKDLHHVELWTSSGKSDASFNFPPGEDSDRYMYKRVKKSGFKTEAHC